MSLYTLTVDLLARTGSFERDMGNAARSVESESRRIQRALSENVTKGTDDAAAGFRRATVQLVSFGAAMAGLRATIGLADEWTNISARVRLATESTEEFQRVQARLRTIANETYRSYGEAADQFASTAKMMRELGFETEVTLDSARALGLALVAGGSDAQRGASAMSAWTKAMALGRIDTEKWTTLMEQTPRVAEALAAGLGKTTVQMTEMARAGQLTAQVAVPALISQMDQLAAEVESMPTEFRDAVGRLKNEMLGFVGSVNDASGATAGMVRAVEAVAENLPLVTSALGAFASVKVTEVVLNRMRAMTASIQVERAHAAQTLASARALEARTAAQVVDAGMMVRSATSTRAKLTAEAALTKAVQQHTVARQQLTAAEAAAAAAGAGSLARAGRSALALFGGPWGLTAMVGMTAASWLLFRDNAREAESALANWNGTAAEAVEKFRELNREQRAGALLRMAEEIEESLGSVGGTIDELVAKFQQLDPTAGGQLREIRDQFLDGQLAADDFTAAIADLTEEVMGRTGLAENERAVSAVTRLNSSLADAAREADRKRGIIAELADENESLSRAVDGSTGAIQAQTEQMEAAAAAATNWGNKIQNAIRDLPGQIERVGKSAREVAQLDVRDWIFNQALAEGITSTEDPRFKELQEQGRRYIELQTQLAAASDAARSTTRSATTATDRQAESIARYNREAEMAAATLAGPLQQAETAHRHRLADLDAELRKGNISQEAYNTLKAQAADQLERTTRALEAQQRAPADLLGAMREEFELLGMIGPEREIYRRGLQAEREMRDAINRANEAGAGINDEVGESLIRQARAWGVASVEIEEAARAAEAWQWTVMGSVEGVADLFTDVFAGQIKSTRDFFTELKDIWKRGWWDIVRMSMQQSFVNPIQRALAGMMSGQGFAGAGMGPGAMAQGLAGTVILGGSGATAIGAGTATGTLYPGWGFAGAGVGGLGGPGGMAGGGFGMPGMMPSRNLLTGEFAGGMPYASAALGILGAYYGLTQRGNNALTSGMAGLSYGALGIGVGGAIAGGLGAIGTGAGLAGVGAGAMGGATSAMGTAAGAIGSASWIPVVGWVLAALGAIDAISGGRLFGTKYRPESITQDIGITETGGIASASVHETRKRSLFRGTARRDRDLETTAEQREAAAELFDAMERVARAAATQLGLSTVRVVSGSIRQVFDRDGNLQSEIATVLGRTYEETFEQFTSRLASEQMIAAVGQIDSAASRIAQDWRHSAEVLAEGAEFFMTAASDARNGLDLWTGIGLQALTDFVGQMRMGEETLGQAYSRLAGIAGDYGSLITDINTQIVGEGLNDYQQQALQIERTYRQQVKAANDYAKALGLSGARAEDLAKIEELRALNMGKLQAQMEADNAAFLGQLALSDLSTLRDDQKLAEAMTQLRDAVDAGDTRAAQQAAQAALGFGRNLYASGRDYQSLYDQVTGQLRGMTLDPDDLDMGDLADEIEAMHEGISRALFELAARGEQTITAPIRAEQQRTNQLLGDVLDELRRQGRSADSQRLANELNGRQAVMVR